MMLRVSFQLLNLEQLSKFLLQKISVQLTWQPVIHYFKFFCKFQSVNPKYKFVNFFSYWLQLTVCVITEKKKSQLGQGPGCSPLLELIPSNFPRTAKGPTDPHIFIFMLMNRHVLFEGSLHKSSPNLSRPQAREHCSHA